MLVALDVADVMSTSVATVSPSTSVREAAARLTDVTAGSVIVCEGETPTGILTEADVTRAVAEDRADETTAVATIMSQPVHTIPVDASIEEAATLMRDAGINRLPVVEEGRIVGLLTTSDLAYYLPRLWRLGRDERPAEKPPATTPRLDTAYERSAWSFEYFGDEATIDVGDRVTFSKELSADDVTAFAEASGDTNRLHLDEEYAAATRFGRRIAHGTLVTGLISAALARLPGLIIYLSQNVSYLGPVDIGEPVTAEATVVESIGEDRYRLTTTVSTASETVVDGEAVVMADPIPVPES